jgi:hypothetical protein
MNTLIEIKAKALEQAVISFTYLEQPRVGSVANVTRLGASAKKITDRAKVFEQYLSGTTFSMLDNEGIDPSLS